MSGDISRFAHFYFTISFIDARSESTSSPFSMKKKDADIKKKKKKKSKYQIQGVWMRGATKRVQQWHEQCFVYWTWPAPARIARAKSPKLRNGRARWRGTLFPTGGGLLPWPWRHPPVTSWINTHRRMRPRTPTHLDQHAYPGARSDVCR